jgi:RNA polymerase sigma factor (sigma-70 family)
MNQSVPATPQTVQATLRAQHRPHTPLAELDPSEEQAVRRRLGSWSRFDRGVSAQDFDDAYQDAWVKLLKGEREGRRTRNREGALRWAVRNSWLEELRRRRRRQALVALESAPEAALVANGAADPAERVELREAARYLFASVEAVTERQWRIFLLADVFGLRPGEIQQRLGIGERVYQVDHARALQAIAGRLGELMAGDWCEQHRDPLEAHAAGEASSSQERQARRHLRNCPACRRRLAAYHAARPAPAAA